MKYVNVVCAAVAVAVLCLSVPLLAAIQLTPVVSGLTEPLFLTHAGDGSNRLFVVEQRGTIRVVQPNSTSPSMFLDIRSRVLAGGERGLLGLAFHPFHESNGRFFVYYTRTGDGAIVVSEHGLTGDRNVGNPSERVLMVIPHPNFGNHNGGMLAFGPDNFLYIGVGDGGSGNDPFNNAQDLSELLGKVLRIDVNAGGGLPYASPPGNPFVNQSTARSEIFASGLRNPWRFSFDRFTGQLWLADVGQGAREEVNMPIVGGGNYGWRVYEGTACSGVDPFLCNPSNFILPIFDYTHAGGRCSITGGYVYRGSQSSLPDGSYVYGDFCSGEIFSWNGSSQTVELDTSMNISSFGEDENGELYVLDLNGTVNRISSTAPPPCAFSIAPASRNFPATGGTGDVAVSGGSGCSWTASSNAPWIRITAGASGTGTGSVGFSVEANSAAAARNGTMTIAGRTFSVAQNGTAACAVAISPAQASYTRAGGAGIIAVSADDGCDWRAVSNSSWIRITGEATGSGTATVTYEVVQRGGGLGTRGGKITIGGQTVSIRQAR